MSDPAHKRHAELVGWLGRRDPNVIDREAMDAALARVVGPAPPGTPRRKRGRLRS